MKRFRLSTLMLLIVIAALSVALLLQQHRASRREAELEGQLEMIRARDEDMSIERAADLPNSVVKTTEVGDK
jgi:hypothetical protein